jgi:hypothetical protein
MGYISLRACVKDQGQNEIYKAEPGGIKVLNGSTSIDTIFIGHTEMAGIISY